MNGEQVLFSGSASIELAQKISAYLDIKLGEAETSPHPNGESKIRINTNVRDKDVFVVQSICRQWLPTKDQPYTGVNDCLFELLLWIDALARASAGRITAVIPYYGYARQDRKAEGRTPISARVLASCIENTGCNRIVTLDLHSDQIQGFFSHKTALDSLNAGKLFGAHFNSLSLNNVVILSADIGNLKKVDRYRQGMPDHYEVAVIDKRRKPNGEVEARNLIGNVKDKTVIILDDVISTAGTMRTAIDVALDAGAKEFYICATHGEFVGNAIEKLNLDVIKEICVTDSIPILPEITGKLPINILSVANLLGEAIRRIHNGESISALIDSRN